MDDKRAPTVWIVAALLLLLPMLYVGSYCLIVERSIVQLWSGQQRLPRIATYRVGGSAAATVFAPLHWVDRRVRREYWNTTVYSQQD